MAHIHNVLDTNLHFIIDPLTRQLRIDTEVEKESKMVVIQYDHNSERVTFEIPKKVDGHDMSTCNVVQVHYLNVSTDGRTTASGVYEVKDLKTSGDVVVGTWLISQNATQLAGTLNFLIRFVCTTGGNLDYVWNTAIYQSIAVSSGLYHGEEVVVEYADILEEWRQSLIESGGVTDDRIKSAVSGYMAENPVEVGLTDDQIAALDGLFKIAAYTENATAAYSAFMTAFGITNEGGGDNSGSDDSGSGDSGSGEETLKTLSRISVVYTGGSVAVGTSVKDLTGITVTAHYSDGSTVTVTGYTLSGTIAEGSNTITVSYGGKTANFTVTGVTESADPIYMLENVDSYEIYDRYNTANSLNYVNVTGGNHVKIFGDNDSANWYLNVNLSSLATNGQNKANVTDTWFTVPAGAECELKLLNIAYANWNTANTNINVGAADGNFVSISLKDIGTVTEKSAIATATTDTIITNCYTSFMKSAGGYLEFDIEFYVNGERWI